MEQKERTPRRSNLQTILLALLLIMSLLQSLTISRLAEQSHQTHNRVSNMENAVQNAVNSGISRIGWELEQQAAPIIDGYVEDTVLVQREGETPVAAVTLGATIKEISPGLQVEFLLTDEDGVVYSVEGTPAPVGNRYTGQIDVPLNGYYDASILLRQGEVQQVASLASSVTPMQQLTLNVLGSWAGGISSSAGQISYNGSYHLDVYVDQVAKDGSSPYPVWAEVTITKNGEEVYSRPWEEFKDISSNGDTDAKTQTIPDGDFTGRTNWHYAMDIKEAFECQPQDVFGLHVVLVDSQGLEYRCPAHWISRSNPNPGQGEDQSGIYYNDIKLGDI